MKPPSKQLRWQRKAIAEGRCYCCGSYSSYRLCQLCADAKRKRQRDVYRKKNGIPLDAPVRKTRPITIWPE